jgi:hypothetical protein
VVKFLKKLSNILIIGIIIIGIAVGGYKFGKKVYGKFKRKFAQSRYSPSAPGEFVDDIRIFVASSLDRIFQDGKTLVKPEYTLEASISAARNEYESFQIVVQSKHPLKNVYFLIADFKDEKGHFTISSSNVTGRKEGYVPTIEPYYPVRYVGLWPDPLMPFEKTDIDAQTQPFWITVHVPSDSNAGIYRSKIVLYADGIKPREIPLKLKVYDFEISNQNHLKTAFDFYGHLTKTRYPQQEREPDSLYQSRLNELNDNFITTMIKYRQHPVLNIDPSSSDDLNKLEQYMPLGLNNFAIGKKGGTFDNNWPKDDEGIEGLLPVYQGYGESLKLAGLLRYAYIYTWDEGEIGNPLVPKIASMIHRAYPGLRNMVCYHGLWDPDALPGWGKDIDIWCFNIDDFNETLMHRLQKMGIEMWMYVSGPNGSGTPNLVLDSESIEYRILPWICWKYDVKGFLYWCVNWWRDEDPFKTAHNTKWQQNGNGLLFYPGPDGPIASIRSEIFRDGMEDYEYIQMLFFSLKSLKEKGLEKANDQLFKDSIRLLTVDPSIAQSTNQFTRNQQTLVDRRNAIAEKIEEINHILASK